MLFPFIGQFTNYFHCCFLPAEARKRQKIFFTHAAEGTESNIKGEVCFMFYHTFLT